MRSTSRVPLALAFLLASFCTAAALAPEADPEVTAVDVLLDPDDVMVARARAANARLRADFPKGFALDADHAPHITVLQAFVRTRDLAKVHAAVARVTADEAPTSWVLKATGYYDIPIGKTGVAGIVIEPTKDLLRFQKKIIDAVAPFTAAKGGDAAFVPRKDGGAFAPGLAAYVADFVTKSAGKHYNPHVTVGVGTRAFLDKLEAEKFEAFTFKARSVSVYQLGDFGTAQRLLWTSADPLPSWNDGPAKKSILDFVAKVTEKGGKGYVKPSERIAVFDNDGTLWPENPVPFQLAFALDRVKALAPKHPEWKEKQPFKAVLEGDLPALVKSGKKGLVELILATHTEMTTDEFDAEVRGWLKTARHPRWKRPYTDLTYRPMQEVLKLLRANGFKTYIVSGGGAEFMRVWSEDVYGIPPEQVVGTLFKTKFELREGKPALVRLPEVAFIDDKEGKPVGIHQMIGRRPIACFGNSDGDVAMLQWTTTRPGPSFGLIVHHTDGEREYAYDRHPKSSGKLDAGFAEAKKHGWTMVDMKKDWKRVFAFDE